MYEQVASKANLRFGFFFISFSPSPWEKIQSKNYTIISNFRSTIPNRVCIKMRKKILWKKFLLLLFKMICSKGFPDPNNKSGEVGGGIFDLPPSDERKLRSPGIDKLFWILVGLVIFWIDVGFSFLDFCWILERDSVKNQENMRTFSETELFKKIHLWRQLKKMSDFSFENGLKHENWWFLKALYN